MTAPPTLPVEHWNFQVDSPFRAPAEIRELASTSHRDGGHSPRGTGGPWAEAEDVLGEDLALAEDEFEAYDEPDAAREDEAYDEAATFEQQVTTPTGANALQPDQATAWVRKVDERVRSLFNLSGPGLVRRVRFVDQEGFASRFPRAGLVPLLVNEFSLPTREHAGTPIQSIFRYHHRLDWLEALRDAKHLIRRRAELRTFIRERIRAGSFVTSSPFGEVRHTPRHLVAQLIAGFTTIEPSRSARRVLIQMPADVEVLVHEACHFYVANAFNSAIKTQARDRVFVGLMLSEILKEGMAEHFAREVMRVNASTFGPIRVNAYQGYVDAAARFIQTAGEESARAAYFTGSTAAIARLFRAIELNIRDYPLMVPDFMLRLFDEEASEGDVSQALREGAWLPCPEAQGLEYEGPRSTDFDVDGEWPTAREWEESETDWAEAEGQTADGRWELEETEKESESEGPEAEDLVFEDIEASDVEVEDLDDEECPETAYEEDWAHDKEDWAHDKEDWAHDQEDLTEVTRVTPKRSPSPMPMNTRLSGRRGSVVAAPLREVADGSEAAASKAYAAVASAAAPKAAPRLDLGVTAAQVGAYDWAFKKAVGARFKTLVEAAAKEIDMNPGLVAENLLAEARRRTYLSRGQVSSYQVGTDDFYANRNEIAAKVPAFKKLQWDAGSKRTHLNDARKPRLVVTIDFDSGRDALLGNAVYLKYGDVVLRAAARAAGREFDALPVETRFVLLRLAVNAGHRRALKNLREVLEGRDVLIRTPQRDAGPQRNATIHTARAMHLSSAVFGVKPR